MRVREPSTSRESGAYIDQTSDHAAGIGKVAGSCLSHLALRPFSQYKNAMPKKIPAVSRKIGFIETMDCLPVSKLPDGSEWTYEMITGEMTALLVLFIVSQAGSLSVLTISAIVFFAADCPYSFPFSFSRQVRRTLCTRLRILAVTDGWHYLRGHYSGSRGSLPDRSFCCRTSSGATKKTHDHTRFQ